MKTIRNDKKIKRVPNEKAEKLVYDEDWRYCPKSEWKGRLIGIKSRKSHKIQNFHNK